MSSPTCYSLTLTLSLSHTHTHIQTHTHTHPLPTTTLFVSACRTLDLSPPSRLSLLFFSSPPSLSSYIGPMTLFARRALKGEDPHRCQYSPADENRNSMEPWQSLACLCSPRCKFGYASSRVCLPQRRIGVGERRRIFSHRGFAFYPPLLFPVQRVQSSGIDEWKIATRLRGSLKRNEYQSRWTTCLADYLRIKRARNFNENVATNGGGFAQRFSIKRKITNESMQITIRIYNGHAKCFIITLVNFFLTSRVCRVSDAYVALYAQETNKRSRIMELFSAYLLRYISPSRLASDSTNRMV